MSGMSGKLKWVYFALVFSCFLSLDAWAGTVTAVSCSSTDVQTAINSSSNGDTVQLPSPCSAVWNSPIVVSSSRQITLNGQGAVITWGSSGSLSVTTGSSNNTFVTGFIFYGSFANGGCPITFNVSSSAQTFRFHGDTLDDGNPAQQGTMLCVNGLGPGLIDHNSFTAHHGADEVIHNLGSGSPTNYSGWSVDVTPGGPNTLFIEDNTFTYASTSGYFDGTSAIENYYGATVVFRYNTVEDMQFDAHGSSPGTCSGHGTENSTRWYEVYNNTFDTNGVNQSNYTDFRGGSGVAFNNTITGTNTTTGGIEFTEDCSAGGTWPLNTQVGRGINQNTSSPAYAWGNNPSMDVYSPSTYVLVGPTTTATSQCSSHSGSACDVVSAASQPAALERCQSAADVAAGCPVNYSYTPYTYPHPLTGGSLAPPTALSAVIQ